MYGANNLIGVNNRIREKNLFRAIMYLVRHKNLIKKKKPIREEYDILAKKKLTEAQIRTLLILEEKSD